MPHEVYIIGGPSVAGYTELTTTEEYGSSVELVARSIAETYDKVAKRGGRIVGDHTLSLEAPDGFLGKSVLFLVADIPDSEKED